MGKYKDVVKRYVTEYNKRFMENKDKIIEAFVMYYGEEFRNHITDVIDNVIVAWNVNHDISELYANGVVRQKILANRLEYSKEILKRLGYDIEDIRCKAYLGGVTFRYGKACIDPGMILDAADSKTGIELDGILEFLFGKRRLFDFDYKNDLIYNFHAYSEEGQKEICRIIFGKSEVDEDCLQRINTATQYMDSIRGKQEEEAFIVDFSIISKHLDNSALHKNILNRLFGLYRPEIIGSYNDVLAQKKYRPLAKDLNNGPLDMSFCVNIHDTETDELSKVVLLPILCSSDSAVMHELNHGVTSEILAAFVEGGVLEKHGLSIGDDTKKDPATTRVNLEELVNQASSLEITDLFHQLGGRLFDDDLELYGVCEMPTYNSFLPLVNRFYSTYKSVLKKPRVTSSLESLFEYADKEVFDEYVLFVNALNDAGRYGRGAAFKVDGIPSFASLEEVEHADELVERMRTATFNEKILPEDEMAELTDFGKLINPDVKTYKKQM